MFQKQSKSIKIVFSKNVHPLKGFSISLFILTICFLICYYIFFKYEDSRKFSFSEYIQVGGMGIIGMGFLSSFLRRYAYSSLGLNYLMFCMIILESTIVIGLITYGIGIQIIPLDFRLLLQSQYCAVCGLISMGAVMGRLSPHQLLWVMMLEVPFFVLNVVFIGQLKSQVLQLPALKSVDVGGGLYVHVFGAYYGLCISYLFSKRGTGSSHPKLVSTYNSDILTLMGTFVLFVLWPTFNSIWSKDETEQFRASLNTVLALMASCLSTFLTSILVIHKIDIVHVQNSTLAGGVAMAPAAAMILSPGTAFLIGVLAGMLSTLSYRYIDAVLEFNIGILDTRGVHNLHALPGILGALVVVFASIPDDGMWLHELLSIFVTLACAIVGGFVSGIIIRQFDFDTRMTSVAYEDGAIWQDVDPDEEPMEYQPIV
eukprot:TRINITY_DN14914_c0_g2_i2.p1 TRINITY_DN14914_c0_g2~~TRINITY_DN14914_c0_g2_i2.p1  ORF type:complete len:428 (+),score=41.48 TRINITY_DN14914_c0_g2_i2:61-1344(+)